MCPLCKLSPALQGPMGLINNEKGDDDVDSDESDDLADDDDSAHKKKKKNRKKVLYFLLHKAPIIAHFLVSAITIRLFMLIRAGN